MKEINAIIPYENAEIPLLMREYTVSEHQEESTIPHWHDDFELVRIKDGLCEYCIGDDRLLLQKDDFLFLKPRVAHYSTRYGGTSLTLQCLQFQPQVLSGNPEIQKQFIDPLWKDTPFPYNFFPHNSPYAILFCRIMDEIYLSREENPQAYEMDVLAGIHRIMAAAYRYNYWIAPVYGHPSAFTDSVKDMLTFIYNHYSEKITLQDIADAGNVSTHRCCELFKEYLNQSPVEYLNFYRMEVARRRLMTTDMSLKDVAEKCGIESPAYFSKMFKKRFLATPREYRRHYTELLSMEKNSRKRKRKNT